MWSQPIDSLMASFLLLTIAVGSSDAVGIAPAQSSVPPGAEELLRNIDISAIKEPIISEMVSTEKSRDTLHLFKVIAVSSESNDKIEMKVGERVYLQFTSNEKFTVVKAQSTSDAICFLEIVNVEDGTPDTQESNKPSTVAVLVSANKELDKANLLKVIFEDQVGGTPKTISLGFNIRAGRSICQGPASALTDLLLSNNRFVSEKAAEALQELGEGAVKCLTKKLKSADGEDAKRIADVLGSMKEIAEDAKDELLKKANPCFDFPARQAAIEALGKIFEADRNSSVTDQLAGILTKCVDPRINILVAEAIARITKGEPRKS